MPYNNLTRSIILSESIVSLLTEPILIVDDSLRAVLANPAFYETLNITPGELEGKPIRELIAAEKGQPGLQAILEMVMMLDNQMDHKQIDCLVPPDVHKTLSVTARRITRNDVDPDLIMVELRDMTRERESEQRLQDLNKALSERGSELERIISDLESFNRWISHDLRTPLRFVNTIAHRMLVSHGPSLPAGARDSIKLILESTHEMGKLIENLLAFSQVDRLPVKRRTTDLARLARKALAELQVEDAAAHRMKVYIEELPACTADSALMQQVLLNLLSNAITFTSSCEQAEIRVGFERNEDGSTVYFVRDNGVGFDMSEAESLFRPFYRLRRVPSPHGTGVGLTLVQRIIERHGGRIWAEGEPGHGATFYFQLGEETKHDIRPLADERREA